MVCVRAHRVNTHLGLNQEGYGANRLPVNECSKTMTCLIQDI